MWNEAITIDYKKISSKDKIKIISSSNSLLAKKTSALEIKNYLWKSSQKY